MFAHFQQQLKNRGLKYSELFLRAIAKEQTVDTAVILDILPSPVPYKNDAESNGNLVILICRNQRPVTIMFRRSNQDANVKSMCKALDVRQVIKY